MIKMIIDCDTGIDDSLALLFALNRPDVRVMAVTTVFGNVDADQAADNSLRLIRLAQVDYRVPVAIGARHPLQGTWAGAPSHIHGKNGIGDVLLPASNQEVEEQEACDLINDLARENPGEITIVSLGRMTNLARALEKEPALPHLIRKVVAMGGTLNHCGNTGPMSEANIQGDPEAADMVMMAGFALTMVGLDVTMKTRLTHDDLDCLVRYCKPEKRAIVDYIIDALEHYFAFNRVQDGALNDCPLHDPTAMIVALDPSVAIMQMRRARVECQGHLTRGMIVTDQRFRPANLPLSNFCLEVDSRRVVATLLSAFMSDESYPDSNDL